MPIFLPRERRTRRGSNAIEFALTLPFFLMLVLGLMDYGFLFAMQAGIDNATAISCREGSLVDASVASPTSIATGQWTNRSAMFCGGSACNFTPAILDSGPYASPNVTLRCETTRNMSAFTGLVPYPAQINSVSYYRLERQPAP